MKRLDHPHIIKLYQVIRSLPKGIVRIKYISKLVFSGVFRGIYGAAAARVVC